MNEHSSPTRVEHELTVAPATTPQRLDLWLAHALGTISRSSIKKLINAKAVLVNGKPCQARTLVQPGDRISLRSLQLESPPHSTSSQATTRADLTPDVIYEDAALLVVNKPAGLSVHPGGDRLSPTLLDWLLAYCPELAAQRGSFPDAERPGIVHRLDKDTSGLLVLAKSPDVHRLLAAQFKAKSNERSYLALLDGLPPWQEISYTSFLGRHPRKRTQKISYTAQEAEKLQQTGMLNSPLRRAVSHLRILHHYAHRLALAKVRLETGRTHQIRVQCQALGFPVWGDPLYNRPKELPAHLPRALSTQLCRIKRQLLHAASLGFSHPERQEFMRFEAPLPEDFQGVLTLLAPYKVELRAK